MVPCGLAGHRHCTVSVSRHTLHLRVVFFKDFLYIYIYIFLSIFVLECFILPNRIFYFFYFYFLFCLIMNIHIYNLFYICTGTHACMGFVPDNKLIRILIRFL